ncbi:MAG: hypothetical protein IKR94_04210 [Bacteroidales bacterium]|nr:hypothetical protein [Bacteroidales bacterium]
MKTLQTYRKIISIALALSLLWVLAVKSFHTHTSTHHYHTEQSIDKVEDVCAICDFIISPYNYTEQSYSNGCDIKFEILKPTLALPVIIRKTATAKMRAPPPYCLYKI